MTAGQGDGAIRRRTDRDSLSGQGAAASEDREPKPVVPIRVGEKSCRKSGWKPPASHPWKRPGQRRRCGPLLPLRPKRWAQRLGGLRFGGGPHRGKELVTKRKKGHFKRGNEGEFISKVDIPNKAVLTLRSKLNRIFLALRRETGFVTGRGTRARGHCHRGRRQAAQHILELLSFEDR